MSIVFIQGEISDTFLHPAVVISPSVSNGKVNLAICCPDTNRNKGYPFKVAVPRHIKTSGVVLSDQVKCLDWKMKRAKFIENLSFNILKDILAKLNMLVG